MAKILKEIPAHCPKCDRDVHFQIEMCLVEHNGIIPCLRCPTCNVYVPAYSFPEFLRTGTVVISM
jgi:hypothetical protein